MEETNRIKLSRNKQLTRRRSGGSSVEILSNYAYIRTPRDILSPYQAIFYHIGVYLWLAANESPGDIGANCCFRNLAPLAPLSCGCYGLDRSLRQFQVAPSRFCVCGPSKRDNNPRSLREFFIRIFLRGKPDLQNMDLPRQWTGGL